MCTNLSWWVAGTLEEQPGCQHGDWGLSVMDKPSGSGRWEWQGAETGHGCLCASSLQGGCEGARSEAGADLPCLASRLSCMKSVTLSFPQISTGYWDDIVLACSLRKAAALWNQLRQFGPSFHLLTPHTCSRVWPWFHGPEMSKNQSGIIIASARDKSPGCIHRLSTQTQQARCARRAVLLASWRGVLAGRTHHSFLIYGRNC